MKIESNLSKSVPNIYFTASGIITAITTAFKVLLNPFVWAGIFVPMLPQNALAVMEAPVPFIGKIRTKKKNPNEKMNIFIKLNVFMYGFVDR